MATDRHVQEMIARCVSIMVCHHNGERTREATAAMIADVQAVASEVLGLELALGETKERILHPVEAELFVRHGREVGSRINSEFLAAFEDSGHSSG